MKAHRLLFLFMLIGQFLLVSCDDLMDIFKPKDDPTKDEIYAPKTIEGVIELPEGSDIDLSGCEILSIYGEADITGSQFNLDIESAQGQQMVYFTDEFGNILMLNFANDEKSLSISPKSTSVALIMLMLQASGVDQKGWNEITAEVVKNKNFPYLQKEVEDLIKSRIDILSEDNTDLMTLCGQLVDDLITENKNALKSIMLDDELAPLVLTQSGTKLSITNNGTSPAYQISVSKDGKVLEKKNLDASVMADVSAGSILTWTWGLYKAPAPISFSLDKAGDYDIRASSIDTEDGLNSPAFLNTLDITKNLITVVGLKAPKTCLVEGVKTFYNLVPAQIVELNKKPPLDNLGLAKWWINSFFKISLNAIKATALCGGSTNQSTSYYGSMEKYLNYAVKGGTFLLKSFDFVSKGGAIINLGTQISFWAYQDMEIFFCKRNEKNELVKCDVPFNSLYVSIIPIDQKIGGDGAFVYKRHCNPQDINCKVDETYTIDHWYIGSFSNGDKEITKAIFTKDSFSITYSFSDHRNISGLVSVNGEINNDIIKTIIINQTMKDNSNGTSKVDEYKTLNLKNIDIPLKSFKGSGYFDFYIKNPEIGLIDQISEKSDFYTDLVWTKLTNNNGYTYWQSTHSGNFYKYPGKSLFYWNADKIESYYSISIELKIYPLSN